MNEYYNTINKILQTLESNINITSLPSTTIDQKIQQQQFQEIDKSFTQLITLLKESDENGMVISVLSNSDIALRFINIFQTHIICCNNNQSSPLPNLKSKNKDNNNINNNNNNNNSILNSQIDKLAINSLRSLGFFLYSTSIIKCLSSDSQIREISTLLENTIQVTKNKNICNYAIWCFSSQSFPNGPISNKLPNTYCDLLANTPFNSKTIENEVLNSFTTLLQQNLQLYLNSTEVWLPIIFNKILRLENLPNITDKLKQILDIIVNHYQMKNNVMSERVSDVLLSGCNSFMENMGKLFDGKNEILSIQCWGIYVFFTGKLIFVNKMANKVLGLAEKCFTHENKLVRIETYNSWKLLIDSMDIEYISVDKRLELFCAPFMTGFTSERETEVKKVSFSTWMYFLKQFKTQLFDVFNKVFTPLFVSILKNKKSFKDDDESENEKKTNINNNRNNNNNNNNNNCADFELGESALHLLVSITAPSQEVRRVSKLKLQGLYGIVLDTLPLSFNSNQVLKCITGDLEPFTLAVSTNFLSTSTPTKTILPYSNEKIEIWSGLLKRMSNIDKRDQNYLPFLKSVLLFIQKLFAQLDPSSLSPDDHELWFYRSIYQLTISNVPNSVLIGSGSSGSENSSGGGENIIENINGGKNYIAIDFFSLNLIEFGFKLNSDQIKEFLIPLFEELCSCSFSSNNYVDLASRLNFIVGVMNDNVDSDVGLVYLLQLWFTLTKTIQSFIKKSHQLLSLPQPLIIRILESVSNLLVWPLRAIASTPYSNDTSIKPGSMLESNSKLWKSTFQSLVTIFSIKTTLNPTIGFILQTINDLQLSSHFNYFDFILSIITPLVDNYDITPIVQSSGNTNNNQQQQQQQQEKKKSIKNNGSLLEIDLLISNILLNLNIVLMNSHHSKMIINGGVNQFRVLKQLSPLFESIGTMIKKCKSVPLCLAALKNMEGSFILYLKDGGKPTDQTILTKLTNEDKYILTTLIKSSFFTFYSNTLDVLINDVSTLPSSSSFSSSSPIYNNKLLEQLELLIISAFTSLYDENKEKILFFWNETWGRQNQNQDLIYPSKLYKCFKKLENRVSIKLPNFQNQQNNNSNNKRSNSHLGEYNNYTLELNSSRNEESQDDFNLPESELNKFNNHNINLINKDNKDVIMGGKSSNTSTATPKNKKQRVSTTNSNQDKEKYVFIDKPIENDISTQSLTDHQMEILEKQKLKRNSSTSLSSSLSSTGNSNNNTPPTLLLNGHNNNNNDKYIENEDLLSIINSFNNKLFENQSTLSLLQIQTVSLEISNKVNMILKNRLFNK
ncbi:hypothetical protein ACTFIV_009284 [Dictyostelium citrinum]